MGTVSVTTPVLPGTLKGPAYLISHGGESFPDLDLVLQGDGVEVVLVGHTHISSAGITTSTFESLPDVPISSVTVDLPMGPDQRSIPMDASAGPAFRAHNDDRPERRQDHAETRRYP